MLSQEAIPMTARNPDAADTDSSLGTAKTTGSDADTPDDEESLSTTPEDVRRDVEEETKRRDSLTQRLTPDPARFADRNRGDQLPPVRGRPLRGQPYDHADHIHAADRGGHWWHLSEQYDAPDWFASLWSEFFLDQHDLEGVETPEVPEEVDWSEYVAYKCRHCRVDCLNRLDSEAGEKGVCWRCAPVVL